MVNEPGGIGPGWTDGGSGRIAGRFPLGVERHAMGQVDRLLPGVTTLTAHARYYTLHGLIAAEAEARRLPAEEARMLLRRSEVVMAGVSLTHASRHSGMASPHGGDAVRGALRSDSLDVAGLAAEKQYARARWGFWGPYLGSEATLGLVHSAGGPKPGEHLDVGAVRAALGEVIGLAARDTLDAATLAAHTHLCMCRSAGATDGDMLLRRLIPHAIRPMFGEDRRAQSLRLLLRLIDLHPGVESPQGDLSRFLLFAPAPSADETVAGLETFPAWQGVAMRALSVGAWRDLWAWLVREISDYMPVAALAQTLADAMPSGTVRTFRDGLPSAMDDDGHLRGAEYEASVAEASVPVRCVSRLMLGGARVGRMDSRVSAYFEDATEREGSQQLSPTWFRDRTKDWLDRPMRDFAVFITEEVVARSQRLALRKAAFHRKTGRFTVPTRVFVREGHIYRDSREGGGSISLRFNTATTVMAGVGLTEWRDGRWQVTDRGRAVALHGGEAA